MGTLCRRRALILAVSLATSGTVRAAELGIVLDRPTADGLSLVGASVIADEASASVVHRAATMLADDLGKVTGRASTTRPTSDAIATILVGTLGDGGAIDQLAESGKLDVEALRGKWETFAWQVVDAPKDGIARALVIVGSDRRGTAYGCTELSRAIGVSPWSWWADVPVPHHAQVSVSDGRHVEASPGVTYRGIFLNDEDFGLRPWSNQTFDPNLPGTEIGPKTYEKLFELMLRLRLNYLWPAMHPGSGEFGSVPGNAELADRWAIVMGASHCEPMLRNNVYWDKAKGPWRYDTNRENIRNYWSESATSRGDDEAVWTLGIRGIHDRAMEGPDDPQARIAMVEQTFADQRALIREHVTDRYGTPAECFVPYKEVLPLYNAGLKVPDEATLVWPDDNWGYIRHLPTAAERARSGGNGVYYHVSYWGGPHSYLWVESTPIALMWEELHKAYENDAKRLWVVNVGDLKPAEVAIDFYSQLAWNPDAWGPDAQDRFLHAFLERTFGANAAKPLFELQSAYYRTASRRKPETFLFGKRNADRIEWLDSVSDATLDAIRGQYDELLSLEKTAAAAVPTDRADAYYEMIGYAARALGESGQLYVHLARANRGQDPEANRAAANDAMTQIRADADRYNGEIAGGKWKGMISLLQEGLDWPKEVGGTHEATIRPTTFPTAPRVLTLDASACTSSEPGDHATWRAIDGLGRSGSAMSVLPAVPFEGKGPTLTYAFDLSEAASNAIIRLELLPTMRVSPEGHLRVAISLDDRASVVQPVPGGEANDEHSGPRADGVLSNRVTIDVLRADLPRGRHTLKITALDPGMVLDQIELPTGAVPVLR